MSESAQKRMEVECCGAKVKTGGKRGKDGKRDVEIAEEVRKEDVRPWDESRSSQRG